MTKLEKQLADAKLELESMPEELRHIYTNAEVLRGQIQAHKDRVVTVLSLGCGGGPLNVDNAINFVHCELNSPVYASLPIYHASLAALEESPLYERAQKTVAPQVQKVNKLIAAVRDEFNARQQALIELQSAVEAAKADALATADEDERVKAARAELAKFETDEPNNTHEAERLAKIADALAPIRRLGEPLQPLAD